jgi:hypothetical protein
MDQEKGFEDYLFPYKMYKLWKSIYGLKQTFHNYNQKFNEFLVQQGFVPITIDPCVYMNQSSPYRGWTCM